VKLISALISEYGLIRFFTLTLDPKMVKGDAWAYIHEPWAKLRHRIKRRFPGWRYVAILERHKDRNVPHIHGFTDIWQSQKEWSKHWQESQGGQIVWIEQVKSANASEYVSKQLNVAKYVGKGQVMPSYEIDKIYRTLWRSKNTKAKFELTKEKGWSIVKERVFNEQGKLSDFYAMKGVWSNDKEK
jgi:hypothetical protein